MILNDINKITLDLSIHRIVNVRCVQNDANSRKLLITLTNDGKLFPITPDLKVRYKLCKADNKFIYNDVDEITADGEIYIDLTDQATSYVGVAHSELQLLDDVNDQIISTMPFHVIVEKSVISNESIESTDEFNALNHLIDRSEHIIEAGNEFAEKLPIWESAESDRVDSELQRKANEVIREQQETTRQENETQRILSETSRNTNEELREQNTSTSLELMDDTIERATTISEKCEELYNTQPFIHSSEKGSANGVAELDENGLLLTSQVPGAYDDVLEGTAVGISKNPDTGTQTATGFILSGETAECTPESGIIYIDVSTSIQYRWSSSIFVTTGSNIALGETAQTAGRGDWTKSAYEHSNIKDGSNPHGTKYVDSSGDSAKFNGKSPDYYATTEQLENINVNLSDLFLYLPKKDWIDNTTYGCFSQEIILDDMHENYIPIVSQSFESPIPTELETTEFAKLSGWETKNGSMVFYADTLPSINFTLIVKGTAAKGDAVYGNLNSVIERIETTETIANSAHDTALKALPKSNISLSTAITFDNRGEYALDAVQANASVSGTLANQISDLNTNLINKIYPVGSIYMSENPVSPTTFIGGTWELLKDCFLLGAGDIYKAGSTGGEATHILTATEMPSHNHTISGKTAGNNVDHVHGGSTGTVSADHSHTGYTSVNGNHSHVMKVSPLNASGSNGWRYNDSGANTSSASILAAGDHSHNIQTYGISANHVHGFTTGGQNTGHVHSYSGTTTASGSGGAHNNMPPYKAIYIWKRIA